MMSSGFDNLVDANYESITVKVEHPEYGPMETSTTASELSNMRLFSDPDPIDTYIPFKNDMYQKIIGDDSVIDFIETSIDKFLVSYQKDKSMDKTTKGAERQRVYREKESMNQRERRLAMARQYIRKRRDNESDQERFERLKKQRERIRAVRQARKLNPEVDQMRRKAEAERMKMRRANENPLQRMMRLEKSRMYSRRRRENEIYRKIENEKNRLAHQSKRSDHLFRLQERQRDRIRKKMKRQPDHQQNGATSVCPLEVHLSLT